MASSDQIQHKHDALYMKDLENFTKSNKTQAGGVNRFAQTQRSHEKIKICVSGAAETGHCGLDAYEKGKELGREIVRQGAILVTGATTGIPLYAAVGAKEVGGFTVGFSPAASEREHVEIYRLPLDYMDIVVYTGFGFPGRDLLLTRSADAVVLGCGRVGTIHEFTVAYEDKKPIGVLEGSWHTDEVIRHIMRESHRPMHNVVLDPDPKTLVEKLMVMANENKKTSLTMQYQNYDGWMGDPSTH